MSVLIKGMEMPTRCFSCPMCDVENAEVNCAISHGSYIEYREVDLKVAMQDRPDWCPLIEVPPHGRLIDADAAIQSLPPIEDYDFAKLCTIDTAKRLIRKAFDMQPIVVQADKDGEI